MKILRQRGISLLEVLLSLVIICVILTMVANYFYTQNQRYLLISKAAAQIQQLSSVSYEWQTAQSQSDFTGISLSALQAAGLLASTDNYSQINPWGGSITLSADTNDPHYVLITLLQIPNFACANLLEHMKNVAHKQASPSDCSQGTYYIVM